MFKEKYIPIFIILAPIISIFLLASFIIIFFIKTQNYYFTKESNRFEKEYLFKSKEKLKKNVNDTYVYLNQKENLYYKDAKEKVKKRTLILSIRLNQLYNELNFELKSEKQDKIFKNLLNSNIEKNNYFFAYDINTDKIIQPKNKNIKNIFRKDKKYFDNYLYFPRIKMIKFDLSPKLVFIKYLPKLNWIIGNIEDTTEDINSVKKSSLEFINILNTQRKNKIWIYDNKTEKPILAQKNLQNTIKINSNRKEHLVKILEDKLNGNNSYNKNGIFIKYFYPKNGKEKIAYIKSFEKYNWILGSSFYTSSLQKPIRENKLRLKKHLEKSIHYMVLIFFIVALLLSILSFLLSKQITRVFKLYQKKVKIKEKNLELLNKNLASKIKKGIKEARKKDRILMQQARLARLGVMLNMIAHQWRQPLSEVSSILMELESAVKFKKADEALILECTKDSTKLLEYMSDTIDDFRNFFKPNKKKEYFLIKERIFQALSLAEGAFKNANIKIKDKLGEDVLIYGYKNEFSQVILNIFLNCKDAFLESKTKNPCIEIILKKECEKANLSISDNAGGIKLKNLDLIFEPYYTTKSPTKGTGLGLYISKMIIETNMNGKISVRKTIKNDGLTFEIEI